MKKLATCFVFLSLISICVPALASNSQVDWQRMAQKDAKKQQKQQVKLMKKQLKQEKKDLKKQNKEAAANAKMWKKRPHPGF